MVYILYNPNIWGYFKGEFLYRANFLYRKAIIFLFTVVIEALVSKAMIIREFGDKSGFKGNLLALLLGSISAGPIYAAFPLSKTLLGIGPNAAFFMWLKYELDTARQIILD